MIPFFLHFPTISLSLLLRENDFLFLFFAFPVQDDLFADDLNHLGTCALCHNSRDLFRIVQAVLENTDLDELPGFQGLIDGFGVFRGQAAFSDLEDRIHSHGQTL